MHEIDCMILYGKKIAVTQNSGLSNDALLQRKHEQHYQNQKRTTCACNTQVPQLLVLGIVGYLISGESYCLVSAQVF